jgi:hypothetical protein
MHSFQQVRTICRTATFQTAQMSRRSRVERVDQESVLRCLPFFFLSFGVTGTSLTGAPTFLIRPRMRLDAVFFLASALSRDSKDFGFSLGSGVLLGTQSSHLTFSLEPCPKVIGQVQIIANLHLWGQQFFKRIIGRIHIIISDFCAAKLRTIRTGFERLPNILGECPNICAATDMSANFKFGI